MKYFSRNTAWIAESQRGNKKKKKKKKKQNNNDEKIIVLLEDMNLLAFNSLYSSKQAQKFHTDDSSLPRSG